MTDLIKFVIEMDPELVCKSCGTNDSVHYNYTLFHSGRVMRDDDVGEIGVWCENCCGETEMVEAGEADVVRCETCEQMEHTSFITDWGQCWTCFEEDDPEAFDEYTNPAEDAA